MEARTCHILAFFVPAYNSLLWFVMSMWGCGDMQEAGKTGILFLNRKVKGVKGEKTNGDPGSGR